MANDFSGDSSCVGLWRFESGNLDVDSKDSNTVYPLAGCTADTTNYWEGSASCAFSGTTSGIWHPETSGRMNVNFPFYSSGTVTKGTFCFWFKTPGLVFSTRDGVYTKMSSSWETGSWALRCSADNVLDIYWRSATPSFCGAALSVVANRVYHLGVRLDSSARVANIRVYDTVTTTSTTYSGTTIPNEDIIIEASAYEFGAANDNLCPFTGNLDEFVVFSRVLSDAEIDAIRLGNYPNVVNYSSGDEATLPANANDLTHVFDATDISAVATDDTTYVSQTSSGTNYAVFEFKQDSTGKTGVTASCVFRTTLDPATSSIVLQVYKVNGATWETRKTYSGPAGINTDITITDDPLTSLSDYQDANKIVTFRVYQRAS